MYQFKTEPFEHQRKVLQDSWSAKYYAYFMEMGTGKTKVAIDNMGVLFEQGEIKAALVVAPKGVFDNWVKAEIPAHMSDSVKHHVIRWDPRPRKNYHRELERFTLEDFDG